MQLRQHLRRHSGGRRDVVCCVPWYHYAYNVTRYVRLFSRKPLFLKTTPGYFPLHRSTSRHITVDGVHAAPACVGVEQDMPSSWAAVDFISVASAPLTYLRRRACLPLVGNGRDM